MTSQEYIDKFITNTGKPLEIVINENCLEDMACPECGQRSGFQITMTSIIPLYDDGTSPHGDTEWGSESRCWCPDCDKEGVTNDFLVPNLEDALRELIRENAADLRERHAEGDPTAIAECERIT